MEKTPSIKCDDFDINFENSDSECHSDTSIGAKTKIVNNCSICDICVYNREHAHHTYTSWKEFREKLNLPLITPKETNVEKIILTEEQQFYMKKLWMKYGNNGKKHTHHNHRFIQNIIEKGEDTEDFYREADKNLRNKGAIGTVVEMELTDECVAAVRKVLAGNTYEIGDIIYYKSPSPSFSYNDGLKIITNFNGNMVELTKLDESGNIAKYESGSNITMFTGVMNEGISKTKMTYKLD